MGRKPERYKNELAKGEPRMKEIPYAEVKAPRKPSLSSDKSELKETGQGWVEERAAYRAWKESFIPASQEKMAVSDEELLRQHKELQAILDAQYPEMKIPFWNEQERPIDDKFFISIVENSPGFMKIVSGKRGGIEWRIMIWPTLRPPETATQLEEVITLFQKGGDKKQMDLLFTRLLELFKRVDEHIVS